jgi:flagellar hook protein FlgE
VSRINTAFAGSAAASIDASGNLILTADSEGDAALTLSLSKAGGTGTTDWLQHAMFGSTDGASGGTRVISASIYDSRGMSHVLTMTFQRLADREWDMTASLGDTEGTLSKSSITGIRFNTDGSFNSVASGSQYINIDFGTSANSQRIDLAFGTGGSFDGLTGFGGTSTAGATSQDGYASGTLKSFSINRDGLIEGSYTNGHLRSLGQLQMATFDNAEGLENLGRGLWGSTIASGSPILGTALSGRAGGVANNVLEGSNVESAAELTKLIVAQYGYQLNTRAMSVANRIVQELANVI